MGYREVLTEYIDFIFDEVPETKDHLKFMIEKEFFTLTIKQYNLFNIYMPLVNEINLYKLSNSKPYFFDIISKVLQKAEEEGVINNIFYHTLLYILMEFILNPEYIGNTSERKAFSILALLDVYERELEAVFLQKNLYILQDSRIFLKTILKYDLIYRQEDKEDLNMIPHLITPEIPIFIKNFQGPFDRNLNHMLRQLEHLKYLTVNYTNTTIYTKIDENGRNYLHENIKSYHYVNKIYLDSIELANRFKEWSGHELELFLKNEVNPELRTIKRGKIV